MSSHDYELPATKVPIIGRDPAYSIYLLEDRRLIFFPA